MHGPGTAEGEKGKLPGIKSPLHRDDPDGLFHGRIGHGENAFCQFNRRKAQILGHSIEIGFKLICLKPHASPQEVLRNQPSQVKMRISDRDLIALSVTYGTWISPSAFRPHFQRATQIHMGHRTAAGPHGVDVYHGDLDRIPRYLGLQCE